VPAGGKKFFAGPSDERLDLECRVQRLSEDVHIWFELICNDSDDLRDHYPQNHPRNKGAEFSSLLSSQCQTNADHSRCQFSGLY
jgi:hypothetical protein